MTAFKVGDRVRRRVWRSDASEHGTVTRIASSGRVTVVWDGTKTPTYFNPAVLREWLEKASERDTAEQFADLEYQRDELACERERLEAQLGGAS